MVKTEFENKFWEFVKASSLDLSDKLSIARGDGFELLMRSIDEEKLDGKEFAKELGFSFLTRDIVGILLELNKLRMFKAEFDSLEEI